MRELTKRVGSLDCAYYQVSSNQPRPVKFRTLCTAEAVGTRILKPVFCIQKQIPQTAEHTVNQVVVFYMNLYTFIPPSFRCVVLSTLTYCFPPLVDVTFSLPL